jgi:EAL domain-containing protein (putative c-di-GMP-specific phosphodiesterase class I)/GGDEF domain-containing protein
MIKKYIQKIIPDDFKYSKTEWFKSIENELESYRFNLILILMITASLIPIFLIIYDIAHSRFSNLINYSIPVVILIISMIVLLKTRNCKLFSFLCIFICLIGFILTIFLPNARNIYIVIFMCFIPIAFQLSGSKKGAFWALLFFSLAIIVFLLHEFGLFTDWNIRLRFNDVLVSFLSLVFMFIITYFGERETEKKMETIIKNMLFDESTKLPNRKVLIHSIKENTQYLFAIIFIENFGNLGLIFGYDLSDEILLFFSKQLEKWKDIYNYSIFRLKGNEFGILLPTEDFDKEESMEKLKQLWILLQSTTMPWENTELRLHILIGGVLFNSSEKGAEDFLSKADIALKSSIETHQGVTLFEDYDYMKTTAFHSINLFSILYKNHEKRSYKAFFQPIVNAGDHEIVWYESLLRIENPLGFYESPVKYLSIAESTGLDIDLTHFMIEEAFKVLKSTDKNVSINITFRDMIRPEFMELLTNQYQIRKPQHGKLILEILERNELNEIEACFQFIKKARELGCLIAIDDFGSGYSNFGNLLKLPVDIVKIDGSLIQQMADNISAEKMVENIINFCKQTGLLITAEYVDSPDLATELLGLGVDYLQGFLFGKPEDMLKQ